MRRRRTATALADELGVTRQTVSEWANAKREPKNASTVARIEALLDLEPGSLYLLLPGASDGPAGHGNGLSRADGNGSGNSRAERYAGRLDDLSEGAWVAVRTLIEADEAKNRRRA